MNDRGTWTSASNAEADSLCPGRHLAQQGIVEKEKSDAAEFGTRVHKAWATGDREGLTADEEAVLESVKAIEESVVAQYFGLEERGVIREKRLWVTFEYPSGTWVDHSGQVDVVWYNQKKFLVLDGKMLWGDHTESPRNQQLRDLVCLWYHDYLIPRGACALIQPRITRTPEICEYTVQDMHRGMDSMCERVIRSNDPTSQRIPGKVQCLWCRAKVNCLQYNQWAASLLPVAPVLYDSPVSKWTPQQMAIFCDLKSVARQWIDECEDEIKEVLKAEPGAVPGFKLKEGAVVETITDLQELFQRFTNIGGKLEQFMHVVVAVKGRLKEQVRAVTGHKGQQLDKTIETLTHGIVEIKQNAPSIVKDKESD